MTLPQLGITGSTGRLGGRIARRLAERGVEQRLLVRDAGRAPDLPGAQVVGNVHYADTDVVRRALEGVRTLLMVSAAEDEHRVEQHRAFVDAAAAAGVEHVVYTSFTGAAPDAVFTLGRDHWATEEHLKAGGPRWTMLRDNLYLDFFPYFVGEDGAIRGPAGEGRLAGVAVDDIADAAVPVLLDPASHVGATYDLTGPEALTFAEAAETISQVTGREVRFVDETLDEAYASRASYGAPGWQVEAWVSTYTAVKAGEMAPLSDHVERLTGHPATSLRELLSRG